MHSKNLLHRDLKPANILIEMKSTLTKVNDNVLNDDFRGETSDYCVKICDFGMTRPKTKEMTPGIVTLWYRAPEILLGTVNYDEKIDIWSLGCILLEMLSKSLAFQSATEVEQLESIIRVLGSINKETFPCYESCPLFEKYNLSENENVFRKMYSKINSNALDLLENMLCINPSKRKSADECLLHPFFQNDDRRVKQFHVNEE